jgi:hypothetical protein
MIREKKGPFSWVSWRPVWRGIVRVDQLLGIRDLRSIGIGERISSITRAAEAREAKPSGSSWVPGILLA